MANYASNNFLLLLTFCEIYNIKCEDGKNFTANKSVLKYHYKLDANFHSLQHTKRVKIYENCMFINNFMNLMGNWLSFVV